MHQALRPSNLPCPGCRDKEALVVVEAIKALFGSLPSASGHLFAAASVPQEGRNEVRRKARAWKLVSHEAKQALPAVPGVQVLASGMVLLNAVI